MTDLDRLDHGGRFEADERGFFGDFGGRFMPEALVAALDELTEAWQEAMADPVFVHDFETILREYAGLPSPLYEAQRLSDKVGTRILLKREDLNHTGAHKIRNVLGQALLTKRMGKTRVIAETGAGQHGVAVRHRRGLLRAGLHGLHGLGRHAAPGSQRGPDGAARRQGGVGRLRQRDTQGRHQRGAA